MKTDVKKLAILGRGTAGALCAAHFAKFLPEYELEWVYDPNTPTQSVGEGSNLALPRWLAATCGFHHTELEQIDGVFKEGIWKENWGVKGQSYMHHFPPPSISYHFNAKKLQNYLFNRVKSNFNLVERKASSDEIDADFVVDCSGSPKDMGGFHKARFIPVNAVNVTQCYWDYPRFQHTLTIARPYGWVFGIPLKNRCSIGYMYNTNINTLGEISDDVKNVFSAYGLTPSNDTNSFSFNNYFHARNYTNRVGHNGNASFFLEPLEATSIGAMETIAKACWDIVKGNVSPELASKEYVREMQNIQMMISLHYFAGSNFDTEFWRFAKDLGRECMSLAEKDPKFSGKIRSAISGDFTAWQFYEDPHTEVGSWPLSSYIENITNLGVAGKLKQVFL